MWRVLPRNGGHGAKVPLPAYDTYDYVTLPLM